MRGGARRPQVRRTPCTVNLRPRAPTKQMGPYRRPARRGVRPDFWVVETFNGLSYGALLFLLASGLSLIFGVMRIVNMAHGSYFMLGGYLGLTVALRTRSFAMAVIAATVAIALVGMAMERVFLRRLRGQDLGQVLMTIGFALIFQDLALLIWGGDPYNLPVPAALSGGLRVGGAVFPVYRIFIVGVAVAVGLGLWLLLDRTRAGAMIRAAVDDGEMAQGVGINVPRISLAVFGLGARSEEHTSELQSRVDLV